MAYAPDLGSGGATREGSSPSSRTTLKRETPMNITSYVEESPTKKSMSLEISLEGGDAGAVGAEDFFVGHGVQLCV